MPKKSRWQALHAECQSAVDNVKADLTAEINRLLTLNGTVSAENERLRMALAEHEGLCPACGEPRDRHLILCQKDAQMTAVVASATSDDRKMETLAAIARAIKTDAETLERALMRHGRVE